MMVFDDLSNAIDVETVELLWQRVRQSGCTCLAVSHRPGVLRRADQILVLEDELISPPIKTGFRQTPEPVKLMDVE